MSVITTTATMDEIEDLVSDYAYGMVVADTAGAALSPPDTFGPMPLRESFDMAPNVSENKKETESGQTKVTSTKEEWALKYITGQVGFKVLQTLPVALKDKIVLMILELNQNAIGGMHMYAACLCKLKTRPGIKNKVSPEFDFEILKATDDIDTVMTALTFPNFSGDFTGTVTLTIPNGEYVGLIEVPAP